MRSSLLALGLSLGIMLAPVAASATDADSERDSTKAYVSDSAITAKVKARLAGERMSSLTAVTVDTDQDGVVYLSGTVPSQTDAERAITIARETEGVRTVRSKLLVKPER